LYEQNKKKIPPPKKKRKKKKKLFGDSAKKYKTAIFKLNHQIFEFFCLVPRSPTNTGLICGKTLEPNISSLGPFKKKLILLE
jgi:hypothetical protein